jgi:hypothetical protein
MCYPPAGQHPEPAVILSLLLACSTSRALAPLEKGTAAATLSVGGPLLDFGGSPLPIPIASVGAIYGLDGKTNVHGAFYPPPVGQYAVVGFDLGVSREFVTPKGARPRLMGDLTAYSFFGDLDADAPKGGYRLFPDVSLIAAWPIPACNADPCGPQRLTVYTGVDNLIQPFPSFRWNPSPEVGVEVYAGRHVGLQLETKWLQPWRNSDPYVPQWYGVGGYGAWSIQLGVNLYPSRKGHP